MSVEDDALMGRMAQNVVLTAIVLGVPMWLLPRLGLWGTPRVMVTVAWGALVTLALVIADRRETRRYQERWVEAERRRVGAPPGPAAGSADRAPTLEAVRARNKRRR